MHRYLILLALCSCTSFIERKAASSTYKILEQSNVAVRRLADVQLAREAAPGGVVQLAAFAAAYPKDRRFAELHAETLCQYSLGFVFDDWEAATMAKRDDEAARIAQRLRGLLATCVDLELALLPPAWRAAHGDDARWTALLPSLARAQVPFVLRIAVAEAALLALDPLAGMARLPRTTATLTRCSEVAPGFHDADAEIFLGTLLAGRARFLGGPDGEAQFAAARKLLGPSALLVEVMYARAVVVARKDRTKFLAILDGVLAADLSRAPELRLSNELARIKAARYRDAVDALFP